MIGPNVKRLIAHRMALLAIPSGTPDPFLTGLQSLIEAGALEKNGREATRWVQVAIEAVKSAPDNPYGDDDEVIAGEILRRVEARKDAQRLSR